MCQNVLLQSTPKNICDHFYLIVRIINEQIFSCLLRYKRPIEKIRSSIICKKLTYFSRSRKHFLSALHKFGSGHRSRGVCPFLFWINKSAPFAAKKHAMDAELFFSAPCWPRPINSLPTSCISCSCLSCFNVWCLRASCRGESPSLSCTSRRHPLRTNSRTIWVCWRSTARCRAVW